MKLFLLSTAILEKHVKPLVSLAGKDQPQQVRIALIENAADPYPEERKRFVMRDRNGMLDNGFAVDFVDLRNYEDDVQGLRERLQDADVVWLGGGNTYYLRWLLRKTGADSLITDLVKQGKLYGGSSAGAIVAGPTTDYFQPMDDPALAPEVILDGLGLLDVVVIPHWGAGKYGERLRTTQYNLRNAGFDTVELTDEQALLVDDGKRVVL